MKILNLYFKPSPCTYEMWFTVLVPDGKPVIGPVPGLMNVIIATGHEGGGLSMVISVSPFSIEEKWLCVFPFLFFFSPSKNKFRLLSLTILF